MIIAFTHVLAHFSCSATDRCTVADHCMSLLNLFEAFYSWCLRCFCYIRVCVTTFTCASLLLNMHLCSCSLLIKFVIFRNLESQLGDPNHEKGFCASYSHQKRGKSSSAGYALSGRNKSWSYI